MAHKIARSFGRSFGRSIGQSLRDAWRLIFPNYCLMCHRRIATSQQLLCTSCYLSIPLTRYATTPDNIMAQRICNLFPRIEHASALVFYSRSNRWRDAIHRLKYGGHHRLGLYLGTMLGRELARSPLYQNLDFVIAVPLHPFRRIMRGYNQSYYIAKAVAKEMGIPYRSGIVRRKRYNKSQVKVQRSERWRNTENLFSVNHPNALIDKRVLLIDDVLTTGATMISCAESIIDTAPSCRLWVASVAASEAEFGLEHYRRV